VKHPEAALERYIAQVAAAPVSVTAIRGEAALRAELVDDALSALPVIGDRLAGPVVDVGSGNGSPGVPIALHYGAPVTLLESVVRKARFLEDMCATVPVPGCDVICARSEDHARGSGRDRYRLALARALAPPDVAAELTLPLVAPGGRLILWTGAIDDYGAIDRVAAVLGAEREAVHPTQGHRQLVVLAKRSSTPERFPRRPGMAGKRPLASLPSTA
jgi:16S rRNA (guanine527-N7)-methyltransferase